MKHMEYQKQISLLLDGALDSPSQRKLLDHLSECADCVRVYEDMVSLKDSLATVKFSLADHALADKVKARISRDSSPFSYSWNFSLLKQVPIWALIAVLAVGVGDKAGKTLTEALSAQDASPKIDTLLQDNSESLSDIALDFGMAENSQ
jgi:predicted anti-sigma-YlaC factor YlaD